MALSKDLPSTIREASKMGLADVGGISGNTIIDFIFLQKRLRRQSIIDLES